MCYSQQGQIIRNVLCRLKLGRVINISICCPSQVNKVLAALQIEVENFILRMAAEFPLRKEQLIFLINNYDMMLSVLMVSDFS